MKYVIDSSVAFKWVVREVDSDKADRLREDFRQAVHDHRAVIVVALEPDAPARQATPRHVLFPDPGQQRS